MNPIDLFPARPAVLEFEPLGRFQFTLPVNYTFLLHWVRRISMREVIGDLGTRLRSPLCAAVQISFDGDFRLVRGTDASGRPRLRVFRMAGAPRLTIAVDTVAFTPSENETDPVLTT